MKKYLLPIFLICVFLFASCTSDIVSAGGVVIRGTASASAPSLAESYPEQDIVYVTKSGTKYHKDGCSYLSSSKRPISLEQAIEEGLEPCSRCFGKPDADS